MDDTTIIKQRILTQNLSRPTAPFTRIVQKYTLFCKSLEHGSEEETKNLRDDLLEELYAVQLYLRRLHASAAALQKEQQFYDSRQEQLQTDIAQTKADITESKKTLAEARLELSQQQQYEAMKKKVVNVPARSVTRTEMAAVEKEIADLQQQSADLEDLMKQRRAQFALIVKCIEQVHASWPQGDDLTDDAELPTEVEDELAEPMQVE